MDDVARSSGVTRLIVYRIFESKYELYTAVLDDVVDDLKGHFDPMPDGDPVAALLVGVGRRHPDGFRLLWRHAAHEPEFADLATAFRDITYEYAEGLIAEYVSDALMRQWVAQSLVSYLYEGICLWIDGAMAQPDERIAAALAAGARAMVTAWTTTPQ